MYVLRDPEPDKWTRLAISCRYLGSLPVCDVPSSLLARKLVVAIVSRGYAYLYECPGSYAPERLGATQAYSLTELGC